MIKTIDLVKKWIIKYNPKKYYKVIDAALDPELAGIDLWSIYGKSGRKRRAHYELLKKSDLCFFGKAAQIEVLWDTDM